jgi:peptidoglycan/xylan/chitin deacetylase (PgdA/CDA1 family)
MPESSHALRITTSWDDGNVLDLRLAELLNQYGVKGTFYIPKAGEYRSLSDSEVKSLSEAGFEIGAHTLTHRELTALSIPEAREEIRGSKEYLENLLGKEVQMFCYPRGNYNEKVADLVKGTGFTGARTVEAFTFDVSANPFSLGTTVQVFPFPLNFRNKGKVTLSQNFLSPLSRASKPLKKIGSPLKGYLSFHNLAAVTLQYAGTRKGVWHLWGHSWEIEQNRMWRSLKEILVCLREYKATFCANGELLKKA